MERAIAALYSLLSVCVLGAGSTGKDDATSRTVTVAFKTVYRPDDGTTTVLSSPPPAPQRARALLAPDDSPSGYTVFPIKLGPDYTFSVPGVPPGSYFLQLDTTFYYRDQSGQFPVTFTILNEMTADMPDLSLVSGARPDLAPVTLETPVTLNVSNLQPWQGGDHFLISSSQADVYGRPLSGLSPRPTPGSISYTGTFDWRCCSTTLRDSGLPDASKNDVLFFSQRSLLPIGIGRSAAELRYAVRYARLTDFTLTDGVPSTLTASLIETPQTGSMSADIRGSQFAALASDVYPTARPSDTNLSLSVLVTPHSVDYPDKPHDTSSSIFYFQSVTDSSSDVDYGTFAYPQFHDPLWKEYRQLFYSYDVTRVEPGTKQPLEFQYAASMFSIVSMSPPPTDPIAPALGPPTAPLVNGFDAFAPQSGVGLQPIFSWSPPRLGAPTSYTVSIYRLGPSREGDWVGLAATVYTVSSFKVPPGLLEPGRSYVATISAQQAPWDVLNGGMFLSGTPYHAADCATGIFIP